MKTLTKEARAVITPSMALKLLQDGNQRFVSNLKINRNLLQQANETADGQYPFAIILSCMDSRTSAELIFDQGLGDIFSVRIAGNIVNEDILASLEFGCKVLGAKLVVVIGHSKCGAILGVCDNVEFGNVTSLLSKIKPSVTAENSTKDNRTSQNPEFVENVAKLNVKNSVKTILESSPLLKDMLDNNQINVIGGMYNITSCEVEFYNDVV